MGIQTMAMAPKCGSETHTIPSPYSKALNTHRGLWTLPPRTPVRINQSHEAEMNVCLLHLWGLCCHPLHLRALLYQFFHRTYKTFRNISKACFSLIEQVRKLTFRVIRWLVWGHNASWVSLIFLSGFLHHLVPPRATGFTPLCYKIKMSSTREWVRHCIEIQCI